MANRRIAKKRKTEQVSAAAELREETVRVAAKKDAETTLCIQYQGWETTAGRVETAVREQWEKEGKDAGKIEKLDIYLKPEEKKAYYVINGLESGSVQL